MKYIIPVAVVLLFPFMLPFMALVLLVAALGKTRDKSAENYGDIKDD